MKLFLRTMLITWAVMSFIAIVALSWPSVLTPPRERPLPIETLKSCARRALAEHDPRVHTLPSQTNPACSTGRLVAAGEDITTDLSGISLSRAERHMKHSVEQGGDLVVKYAPDSTSIAFRADPQSDRGYIYMATLPATQPYFVFRHLATLSPIFIAGFLSLFIAAYVVRPMTKLNAVAEKFGTGDLKVRVGNSLANRSDELGDLARTFNAMAGRIETLVTGYKDFLAHASHELGSPLTRLNIALALAKLKGGSHLEQEHERIREESDRLNKLVHEMLLLARIESGNEVNKETSDFDVRAVVEEAIANAKFEANASEKIVTLDSMEGFVVRGYPVLLQRAIDNVLRNALRFAKRQISVQVLCSSNRVGVIAVQDDGPGISPEQAEVIFEPFLTLVSSDSASVGGGSGLGLAIARQAVLANGGKISARSSPEGGLIVEIEIPALSVG